VTAHPSRPLLVVATGMMAEARIAERGGGVRAVAGGGDGAAVRRGLEQAMADGAWAVMSFGIAGGLAPDIGPGGIIIADAVVHRGQRFETDVAWGDQLAGLIPDARRGAIAGSDTAIASVKDKATLHAQTGAVAVDMESHIAAQLAAHHKRPFACLRVVADDAGRALPPAALAGLAPGGAIAINAVLWSLLRHPLQLSQLIRVASDTQAAMKALLRCQRLSSPTFGARLGSADLG
jgi:adenosylhomocysteine nucleosidase